MVEINKGKILNSELNLTLTFINMDRVGARITHLLVPW